MSQPSVRFQMNPNILGRLIRPMFEKDIRVINRHLRASFDAQYPWTDRLTHRKNGEIAGNPRNIVDTGATQDSQRVIWESDWMCRFVWDSPASYIYFGVPSKNYPARRFIDYGIETLPRLNFIKVSFTGGIGT